ncbi:MAG: AsmA-like C-terminal region-containing protein [Paracoccaceae bacterium]
MSKTTPETPKRKDTAQPSEAATAGEAGKSAEVLAAEAEALRATHVPPKGPVEPGLKADGPAPLGEIDDHLIGVHADDGIAVDPEIAQDVAEDEALIAAGLPRRKRKWHWHVSVWSILTIIVLSIVLVIVSLSLYGRPIDAPQWLTSRVEERVNAQISETGRISLGRVVLLVDKRGVPRITLKDVGLYDGGGAQVAQLNDVRASLSLAALRERRLQPDVLRLSGAQAVLRRRADGQFDISFAAGTDASTGTLGSAMAEIDRAFSRAPLKEVTLIEASDLTLTLEDARSHRLWQVTGGALSLKNTDQAVELSMNFEVFNGTEELAPIELNFTKPKGGGNAEFGARFENAAAGDIALQSPALTFLSVLNAPIAGALRARLDTAGQLDALTGTLEFGQGALEPIQGAKPIGFEKGRAYFTFDPALDRLRFSEVSVVSETVSLRASGQAYLSDYTQGWPSALLGQFALADMKFASTEMFAEPLSAQEGAIDFRLRLDPFTMDIGQAMLREGEERILAKGQVRARKEGWDVSADIEMAAANKARVLALWPLNAIPNTRAWIAQNVHQATLREIKSALRVSPAEAPRFSLGFGFEGAQVSYLKHLPPITGGAGYGTIIEDAFALVIEEGVVEAPLGGDVLPAGTVIRIPDIGQKPAMMEIALATQSSTTAALSLLNMKPFNILKATDIAEDIAVGAAAMSADIALPLKKEIDLSDVSYAVAGVLSDVQSSALAAPRLLSAKSLQVTAGPDAVSISGQARLGKAVGEGAWTQKIGAGQGGRSSVSGVVTLDQGFLDEFGIALPKGSLRGEGRGQFSLDLRPDAPPAFRLTSDLNSMGLRLAPLGWSKARNRTGRLAVEGRLGADPMITALDMSAPGLSAKGGRVTLRKGGALDEAKFANVKVGQWLDAPLRLVGRGAGRAVGVEVTGGRIDVRKTSFGQGGASSAGASAGPITLALDRLIISEGISLQPFRGTFTSGGGFQGDFNGLVNGAAAVKGALAPSRNGPVIRIKGSDGGAALRAAGVFDTARGGALDLILTPVKAEGTYEGRLTLSDTKIVGAPALTEMLSAISVVGLLEQLSGPGIRFTDVEADFRLDPKMVTLYRSSAVGPSLGVSLDGRYDLTRSQMDMQGVISPVYFLNGIGQMFTRKGEGLFGFNFKLSGGAANPAVQVNPLSILTPGMFREIFRRPPPKQPAQ